MKNVQTDMERAESELGIVGIIKILNDGGSLSAAVIKLNMLGYNLSFSNVKLWLAQNHIRTQYVQLSPPDSSGKGGS